MFSYSCPSCTQRLLAPSERAGTKTICPKCLKPLKIPAPDRMAAVDLESVIEPTHVLETAAVSQDSAAGLADVFNAVSQDSSATDQAPARAYDIDLDQEEETASRTEPVIHTEPVFRNEQGYETEPTYQTQESYNTEPTYQAQESYNTEPTYQTQESYQAEPIVEAVVHETPAPSVCVTTMTPPPMKTARAPIPPVRKNLVSEFGGSVNLTPTGLFSVDVAAELSAALSMRMQPPPDTSSERRVTTAAWVIVTLAAMLVWVAGVFFQPEWFVCVALLGGALVVFGLVWRAYLAGRQSRPIQGVLALFPPITVFRLLQPAEDHGYRPLRFVGAGVALLALFVMGPAAHSAADNALLRTNTVTTTTVLENPATKLKELTAANAKDDALLNYLREMPYLAGIRSATMEEQDEINAELNKLANSDKADVKQTALATLEALKAKSN